MNSCVCIVHIPKFRSTRAVWMFHELKNIYGNKLPSIEISTFHDIQSFRNDKPKWLLEMNPNGKVPTMNHGSIVMFESGAICSYFIDQFDVDRLLLPRDPSATALYYLLVSWCASTLDNLTATSAPINIILDKSNAIRPMDDVVNNQKYFDDIFAPYITNILTQNKGSYLCGNNFTAADIIVGFSLFAAQEKMVPGWISSEKFTSLNSYMELLKSRPSFQAAISAV